MENNVSKEQVRAALGVVMAVSETIRELKEVPSGTLYANLMGQLSLEQYTKVIDMLKRTGLVEETQAHLLKWVGPVIPS